MSQLIATVNGADISVSELRARLGDMAADAGLDPIMLSMFIAFLNLMPDRELQKLAQLVEQRFLPLVEERGLDGIQIALKELDAPPILINRIMAYARKLADQG